MAKLVGANVFLSDVDPISGQMTPDNLIKCIKKNKIKKVKAFLTMYLGGNPENIPIFYNLKK
jgi:dTDP-4-amino-4,6-dideoxygalactose transaminase